MFGYLPSTCFLENSNGMAPAGPVPGSV